MKPNLRLAMERADAPDYADHMMQASEAAHQAETRAAALSELAENDAREVMQDDLEAAEIAETAERVRQAEQDVLEAQMRAAAAQAALRRSQALADAHTSVARALARGGHDTASWPPAAALAAENIAIQLLGVQNAAHAPVETAFDAKSSASDIARGAAVGAILAN